MCVLSSAQAATYMQSGYQRFLQAREWAKKNRTLIIFALVVLLAFVVQWVVLRRAARRELEEALVSGRVATAAGLQGGAAGVKVPGLGRDEEEDPFAAGGGAEGAAWGPR